MLIFSNEPGAKAIASSIYQGLEDWYKICVNAEERYNRELRREIMKHSEVLVLVLTEGLLRYSWYIEEIRIYLQSTKQVEIF